MSRVTIFWGKRRVSIDDTVPLSIALFKEGFYVLGRSIKYYRPRAPKSFSVFDRSITMTVNRIPNVNPNVLMPKGGMTIEPPSKEPFMLKFFKKRIGVGFQHKPIIRHTIIWRIVKKFIVKYANNPSIPLRQGEPAPAYPLGTMDCDVLIVGGGLSGLYLAKKLANTRINIILVEASPTLGGKSKLLDVDVNGLDRTPKELIESAIEDLKNAKNIRILTKTVLIGIYEDGILAWNYEEPAGGKLVIINAKKIVIATGSSFLPCIYENNDLPGSVMPTAILKLYRSGVHMKKVAFIGINPTSRMIAEILARENIKVYVLVKDSNGEKIGGKNIEVIGNVEEIIAKGKMKVEKLIVKQKDGSKLDLKIDFVVFGAFENPDIKVPGQAGLNIRYVPRIGFVTIHNEELKASENIFVVGRAAGTTVIPAEIAEAEYLAEVLLHEFGEQRDIESSKDKYFSALEKYGLFEAKRLIFEIASGKNYSFEPIEDVPTLFTNNYKGYKFVCFCEDVTLKDIYYAVKELGMDRFEILKRYTGVATGRCQGRGCLINAVYYMSKLTGKDPNIIGLMRQRPPLIPVPLRVFSLGVGDIE